ncbi:MAG: hypothetical protein ACM37W_14735 [Actinomycetota bacterium]
MSNSQPLTIQLSPEDNDRLSSEAKRRQIDASSLAEILLHDSLTKLNTSLSQGEIESLEKLYQFREKTEVLNFLAKYPFLVPVLLEAPARISHHFPKEPLFLQVVPDPEITDYVHLILSILTGTEPKDAFKRLNQLDRDWELELPYEVRKVFLTNVEF